MVVVVAVAVAVAEFAPLLLLFDAAPSLLLAIMAGVVSIVSTTPSAAADGVAAEVSEE